MKKVISIVAIALVSCSEHPSNKDGEISSISEIASMYKEPEIIMDSLEIAGLDEYKLFKENLVDTICAAPCIAYSYAKVYTLNKLIGESYTKKIFSCRDDNGVILSKAQLSSFYKIINNPKSYGRPTAACFEPYIGVVLYDSTDIPKQVFSVCLSCNNMESIPDLSSTQKLENLRGFNPKTRKELRRIFNSWGIEYYGLSMLSDSKSEIERLIKLQELNQKQR